MPDFSQVATLEKAQELCNAGKLERRYLCPPEFGGTDDPRNLQYVPLGIAAMKKRIDSMVQNPVHQGQV